MEFKAQIIKTKIIENCIKDKKTSKSKFCKICTINYKTLKKFLNNENFIITALFKI